MSLFPGLALSPRKYASADQIHALFTTSHGRQHSLYGKVKHMPQNSSDEKGLVNLFSILIILSNFSNYQSFRNYTVSSNEQ